MGFTVHGIKFPELPDLPNVPDDIGGTGKLDATTQAWLSRLDATNVANLSAQNIGCATTETSVTSATASSATASSRQAAQQSQITAITAGNSSIASRLSSRDTTLVADQSTIQGYAGQITGLQSLKPRGLLGIAHPQPTTISTGGSWQVFASLTFNDTATPSGSRQYRAMLQANVFDSSGLTGVGYIVNLSLFYTAGTAFGTARPVGSCTFALDSSTVTRAPALIDQIFTSVTDSQWTVWAAAQQISAVQFSVAEIGDFLTLEDVGLSL